MSESPYAGDVNLNLRYLRAAMADCLRLGESPYASHGLGIVAIVAGLLQWIHGR